jgi:hypothetical protein
MKSRLLSVLLVPALAACTPSEPPPATAASQTGPTATAASAVPPPALSPPAAPAPASCAGLTPFTLQANVPNISMPVSAVLSGNTLWVLHKGADGTVGPFGNQGEAPELIEVTDPGSASRTVKLHKLPPSNVGWQGALAAYQGGVIGTFVGIEKVIFFYKPAQGELRIVTRPAGPIFWQAAIARVGERAFVSYAENGYGVHTGWFDLATMQADGPMQKIADKAQGAVVADAFGGIVFFSEAVSGHDTLQLRARLAAGGPAFALPAVGKNASGTAASASGGAGRAFVLYASVDPNSPTPLVAPATARLTTLTDEKGNGTTVTLGQCSDIPETAIQRTPWGAMGMFVDAGDAAMAVFVNNDGALIGAPIPVSESGERFRQPAIAADDKTGYVLWNQARTGNLRVAPLRCQ